ncbi:MAG: hypothetical protein ACXQS6_01885 [Candidatus Syntropharchaeales archaeon]|nr:hypothetical protein [Candidatus Syntrophoarchaeum sp.]
MDDENLDVKIVVDENEIDTNPFVRRIVIGVVGGFAEQLNGVDKNWKQIEIVIKR